MSWGRYTMSGEAAAGGAAACGGMNIRGLLPVVTAVAVAVSVASLPRAVASVSSYVRTASAVSADAVVARSSADASRREVEEALMSGEADALRGVLGDGQRGMYDDIYAGLSRGDAEIPVVCADGSGTSAMEAVSEAYYAVLGDHPELPVNDDRDFVYENGVITAVVPEYAEAEAPDIDVELDGYEDERAVAMACLRALCDACSYEDGKAIDGTVAGAMSGHAKCLGYARAYQRMLGERGIRCLTVSGAYTGEGGGGHAWCVALLDGEAVWIDPTFADTGTAAIDWGRFDIDGESVRDYVPVWGGSAWDAMA